MTDTEAIFVNNNLNFLIRFIPIVHETYEVSNIEEYKLPAALHLMIYGMSDELMSKKIRTTGNKFFS